MATWKEQLQEINNHRNSRQQADEQLYATQVKLLKAERLLTKAKKQETILPGDAAKINALRTAIASLEAQLLQLGASLNEILALREKLTAINLRIDFLQKKIDSLTAQQDALRLQLAEAQDQPAPDGVLIASLQKQLKEIKQMLQDLTADMAASKRTQGLLHEQVATAAQREQELTGKRKALQADINDANASLAEQLRGDERSAGDLEQEIKDLTKNYDTQKTVLISSRDKLHAAVTNIYIDPHPRKLVENLDDSIPFLLMPVRLETRFVTERTGPALWLRVYPDDIAVHTHEKTLTDAEVAAGVKYWTALFDAGKSGGVDVEGQKKTAWSDMVALFGPQRSAWIASETKPVNWSTDLGGIAGANDLDFPVHDVTKTSSWSRAPRTQVLPDRFVVQLYVGDTVVIEQTGLIIPDELIVGPDPLEADNAFVLHDDKLVFGDDFAWASDFTKAVQVGMGFKIPLTEVQAARGFDKILVVGLNLSADETGSKEQLEALIDNHHYAPKGFSIVPQGTPTNNTDADGSGYTKNDAFANTSYFVETAKPLCAADENCHCDGKNLADALGIDYAHLEHILHWDATDHAEAVAMNAALYVSTLGYYCSAMLQPVLGDAVQDKLRDFFVQYVTGRGPLPAIRVGNQPYGVLLTSDFSNWQWSQKDPLGGTAFLNGLYSVLSHYQSLYLSVLPQVKHITNNVVDPSSTLMDILGLQSGSVSFYQRVGYSTDYLRNLDAFQHGGKYAVDMAKNFDSKNELLNFFNAFGYNIRDENGILKVPQQLRLVFQHYQTLLDAANLVDNVPLSEKDIVRYYDEAARKNYIHWLQETNTIAALEKQDFGAGIQAPRTLMYMQMRRSLLLQLHDATVRWFGRHRVLLEQTIKPVNFHNIRPQGDVTKWEVMKAPVSIALPDHVQKNLSAAEYLLVGGIDEVEAAFLKQQKAALAWLADKPTARLERCFTEHLDCCTYRLDAWQMGLFNTRLRKQRQLPVNNFPVPPVAPPLVDGQNIANAVAAGNHDVPVKRGIYMASWGVLFNIRRSSKRQVVQDGVPEKLSPKNNEPLFEYTDNGGFVHAPSLNQASAAAVLRSGYMSHATAANPDTMSVNLSSERVRRALFILQGIRNGQPLEALLGYQFERGLHDRGSKDSSLSKLNLYVYDYRDAFPFEQHQVLQQGSGVATEAIPANNVVNGVTLAEKVGVFPFGATGAVAAATAAERLAIEQEKDKLSDSLDAVKDLLLSESVYQLVQGNFDRAGAVVNALKDAQIPPELDIINTPRGTQFTFTNRVTVHFETLDPNDPTNNPWTPIAMTPRAYMEPGINKWLYGILGDAASLVCRVAHTDEAGNELGHAVVGMDKLMIQPIDLVYITGNELNTGNNQANEESKTAASELESRIAFYYRQSALLEDAVPVRITFLEPEGVAGKRTMGSVLPLLRLLKSLITDSRNLHAEDFDPPSKVSLADKTNPKGYDAANLTGRVLQQQVIFKALLNDLNNLPIETQIEDSHEVTNVWTNLPDSFAALDEAETFFSEIVFTFSNTAAAQLQVILLGIAGFGLPDSFPQVGNAVTQVQKAVLLEQARSVAKRMTVADQQATALLAEAAALTVMEQKIEKTMEAGKAIYGSVFNILPLFVYHNEADILLSDSDRVQLLQYARTNLQMPFAADEWMQNVSHVRPKVARWEYIRSVQEITDSSKPLSIQPVQLPYRAKDSWLAVEFPVHDAVDPAMPFTIAHDTLSVAIHGAHAFVPASKQAGLLIDDWTEVIPTKEETTGISFHYNQPNAVPPQSLLLAVTPKETGHWSWDTLIGILNDTLLRSKLRAVEPQLLDKVAKPELGVLLPALMASFSEYDLDVSLDYRMNMAFFAQVIPLLTVAQFKNN